MSEDNVIGITNGEVILCFRCVVESNYDITHRKPIMWSDKPKGFTCEQCNDRIEGVSILPTLEIMNTGVIRNGEIEYTVQLTDPFTGFSQCFNHYGLEFLANDPWNLNDQWGNNNDDDEEPF